MFRKVELSLVANYKPHTYEIKEHGAISGYVERIGVFWKGTTIDQRTVKLTLNRSLAVRRVLRASRRIS